MGIIKSIGTIDRSLTKEQICDLAQTDVEMVKSEGRYDLLRVYVELKRYEVYLQAVLEHIKQDAKDKAIESIEVDDEFGHAKVRVMNRRVFDYSSDNKWLVFNEGIHRLKNQKKDREDLLKRLSPGTTSQFVDEDTGEVEELKAPDFRVEQSLMVSFV